MMNKKQKTSQNQQAESISAIFTISEMLFATIIGTAGYVLTLISQLSVCIRLMEAVCHQ